MCKRETQEREKDKETERRQASKGESEFLMVEDGCYSPIRRCRVQLLNNFKTLKSRIIMIHEHLKNLN